MGCGSMTMVGQTMPISTLRGILIFALGVLNFIFCNFLWISFL